MGDGVMSRKTYLRIIFSSEHETPFLKMNLQESWNFVDQVVIYEANRTHTGEPRDFLFPRIKDKLPSVFFKKINYLPDDISSLVKQSLIGEEMHENERVIRSRFSKLINLKPDDIVVALDADEIIRREIYPLLRKKLDTYSIWKLPLHQFFYRMNYLWSNITFWGPNACVASHYLNLDKPIWRDEGRTFPVMCGSHFSWQLTIDQMLHKLQTYAHRDLYGHLAKREILEAAILEKSYPFEPERPFNILELDPLKEKAYYPLSFYEFIEDFRELLPANSIHYFNKSSVENEDRLINENL